MKNRYTYTLLAAMAIGFAACQQEDDFAPQMSGDEITITAQVGKAQTRAAVNELSQVETNGFGLFCVGGTNYDKSNLKVTYSESAWTTAEKVLSPGKTTTMSILAYYPYDENRTSASEDYAVTLPTDQSAGLLAADHLTAAGSLVLNGSQDNGDISFKEGNLTIAFRHAFSKVHFNVNLRDQFTNVNITKVEVEVPVTAVLNGATVTVPANAETGKVKICEEGTVSDDYISSYEGIILPGSYTYKVHFTMSNGTVQTYAATTAREFEQNKVYTQSITIGKNGVKVEQTSVKPWDVPEYDNTGSVEEIYMTSTVKGTTAAIDICSSESAGIITAIKKLLEGNVTTLTVNGTLSDVQQNAVAAALTNFRGTLIMDIGTDSTTDAIKTLNCTKYFGGYTYEDNTYTVYTAAGLQTWGNAARRNLATNLTLGADIILPSTMTIDNDGDGINDSNWECLVPNMSSTKYSGTIKGNNHTIYNLRMTGNGMDAPSFIGYECDGSSISDLNFADIHLTGGQNCAAIVFMSHNSTIENCHVLSGTIDGNQYVAGVVGRAQNGSQIVNCSNAATISSEKYAASGITCTSQGNSQTESKIVACRNSGEIKGEWSGGVVYQATTNSIVAGCYNTGTVNGTEYAGGIVSQANNTATVTACYNTGNVTGGICGGVVAWAIGSKITLTCNYIGGSSPSGGDYATAVDDTDVTWETAMNAMNKALTNNSLSWKYVQNTGSDATTCPLIIQAKAETATE